MMPMYRVVTEGKRMLRVFAPSAADAEQHVERLLAAESTVVRRDPEIQRAKDLGLKIVDICREDEALDAIAGGNSWGGGEE